MVEDPESIGIVHVGVAVAVAALLVAVEVVVGASARHGDALWR